MSVATAIPVRRATIDDLLKVPEKAELIRGSIVKYMATGFRPSVVASRIFRSLADYCDRLGRGFAFTDSMGFAVPELTSGRESFSPDTSFYSGPPPANPMKFVEAAPDFAVEVRSENDYGRSAERDMAAKRADYFEAGTLVVWDVDPEAGIVRKYIAVDPFQFITFTKGQIADAEPAAAGWSVSVDWIMA